MSFYMFLFSSLVLGVSSPFLFLYLYTFLYQTRKRKDKKCSWESGTSSYNLLALVVSSLSASKGKVSLLISNIRELFLPRGLEDSLITAWFYVNLKIKYSFIYKYTNLSEVIVQPLSIWFFSPLFEMVSLGVIVSEYFVLCFMHVILAEWPSWVSCDTMVYLSRLTQ